MGKTVDTNDFSLVHMARGGSRETELIWLIETQVNMLTSEKKAVRRTVWA